MVLYLIVYRISEQNDGITKNDDYKKIIIKLLYICILHKPLKSNYLPSSISFYKDIAILFL